MEQSLENTISLLSTTPATLNALLRNLPESWTQTNEGENTWTALEVVEHLAYVERADWIPRLKLILQFGESQILEPVDRSAHKKDPGPKSLARLLDEFAGLRQENLNQLRAMNLQSADLIRHSHHRALGPVTLSQLLATWATHDLTHLHQISRVLAHQYKAAVGPWIKYLGVLHCNAHSSLH
jgi:hypothetical protein